MGRIKSATVKRIALEIWEKYRDRVSTDFEENKKLVATCVEGLTKRVRNKVAGYLVRLKKLELKRLAEEAEGGGSSVT